MLQCVPVFTISVDLGPVRDVGPVPSGYRRVIPILGGTVRGPALSGTVLPGGADWNTVRSDGVMELWARYELQAASGALVSVVNVGRGLVAPSGEGSAGNEGPPVLTVPSFEVAAGDLDWLNRQVFVGALRRTASEQVSIAVHRVEPAPAVA